MPVVRCPSCPTQLKVPDGVRGNTKCPKCGTVFPVGQPAAAPAFEVVDGEPAPKPAAKKAAADEPEFEVEEKPKKRVTADEDDDDLPRKKKKRDYDDDDDDEDDRPRKKKAKKKKKAARYDDDDDEDEDWEPSGRSPRAEFAKAKTGAQLLSIAFWLNMGAYGLLALYALIFWIMVLSASSSSPRAGRGSGGGDGSFLDVLVILPGLAGLGAWIVGIVGCSFAIAGPARARGMAITATVFAGLHLILAGVTFSNFQEGLGGMRGIPGLGKAGWIFLASTLPVLDSFLPMLFYSSRGMSDGEYIISLLAAICEVLRLVFSLLALKELAAAARDRFAAEKAQTGMMIAISVVGGVALLVLLMVVLMREGNFKSIETYMHLGALTLLLTYLGYTFMMLNPAMAAMETRNACDNRS